MLILPVFESPPRELHPPLLLEPLMATGSLGEYRPGHFHYGMDFSTGGTVGAPVYAVDDGFVRRVMFGRYNIGNALWLEHADGRVSKYGHLQEFAARILDHPTLRDVRAKIRLREDYSLHIPNGELRVARGERIATSGETGIGLPHLHFEYFESDSRTSLNPLLHGLQLTDLRPPIFLEARIQPAAPTTRINGRHQTLRIALRPAGPPVAGQKTRAERETHAELAGADGHAPDAPPIYSQEYVAVRPIDVRIAGEVQLQLNAYDPAEPNGRSRLGLNQGRLLQADGSPLFQFNFDRLPALPGFRHGLLYDRFASRLGGRARYVYNYYERHPDGLPFASSTGRSAGRLAFGPEAAAGARLRLTIAGEDSAGNRSHFALELRHDRRNYPRGARLRPTVLAGQVTVLETPNREFRITIDTGDVFEDLHLRVRPVSGRFSLPAGMQMLSPAYAFERVVQNGHGAAVPGAYLDFFEDLAGWIRLAPPRVRLAQQARATQVGVYRIARGQVHPLGLSDTAASDGAHNERYHFRTRSTGVFAVLADRRPPEFRPVARFAPGLLRGRATRGFRGDTYQRTGMRLFLRPRDTGSGLALDTMRVTVDGVPARLDHDPDRKHVEVFAPASIYDTGKHILIADIADRAGNQARTFRYDYRVAE